MECDHMWNFRNFRWELHLPHIPEIRDSMQFQLLKKTCWGDKNMRCPLWSAMISVVNAITPVECDDACGVRRSVYQARQFLNRKKPRKANRKSQKCDSQSQPNPWQTRPFFLFSVSHLEKKSLDKPFPSHWAEISYNIHYNVPKPGLEYDEHWVCDDFLKMAMLPLDYPIFTWVMTPVEQCEINPSIIPWNTGWFFRDSAFLDYCNPHFFLIVRTPNLSSTNRGVLPLLSYQAEWSSGISSVLVAHVSWTLSMLVPCAWGDQKPEMAESVLKIIWLVVDLSLWKVMELKSVGMMTFPIWWEK